MPSKKAPEAAKVTVPSAQLLLCQKTREEYLAGWQRSRADFINYKKEVATLLKSAKDYGAQELISNLLPIIDNFEAAERALNDKSAPDKITHGFLQIKKELLRIFSEYGLEQITTLGQKFDPALHEAVGQVKVAEHPPGQVVEQLHAGYKFKGQLIRAALVKTSC